MVAGTCSPVDLMYVTPKPAIATLFMVRNHSKTDSIGLQYQFFFGGGGFRLR